MSHPDEKSSIRVEWDSYNTLLLLGKVSRDVEKIRSPVQVEINPGSLETIISLVLKGADAAGLAGSIYDYIRKRRKKAPKLEAPAIDTGFLVQLTIYRLREMIGRRRLKLVELVKSDKGTTMTFADEVGTKHTCTVDFSGEIIDYHGPFRFSRRSQQQ